MRKKLTYKFIEGQFEKREYRLLSKEYINNKQKLKYICKNGHRHSITWSHWNRGERCPTCKSINMSGDKHHAWKGGIACEPYCDVWLDKEYKDDIKLRDNYECQNPNCWGTSKRLCLHHIDYNKKHCDPWNLITLCNSCNIRANFNRECWIEYYTDVMKNSDRIRKGRGNETLSDNSVVDINVTQGA